MKLISAVAAANDFGIASHHEQMENGECRFRLLDAKGNGYIRTMAGSVGAWQKSHRHAASSETYLVETGWLALALASGAKATIAIYRPRDLFTVECNLVHNIYLAACTVVHTIKIGNIAWQSDWIAAPEFDDLTLHAMSEQEVVKLGDR